jgi:hypothetical protein
MKRFVLLGLALINTSCSSEKIEPHRKLMDEIDATVVLPKGAVSLEKYARDYALRPDGKVAIFYSAYVTEGPDPPGTGCSEISNDLTAKVVPCPPDDRPKAGARRWVKFDEIGGVADGGCYILNAVYDPVRKRVDKVACNGPMSSEP